MKYIYIYYLVILLSLSACASTTKLVEVPVEKVKIEYKDKIKYDSIYVENNTTTITRHDTVYRELIRYKYIYKKDTVRILKTDTIPKVIKVEVVKEVNKLKNWQKVLMGVGGMFILLIILKFKKLII